MIELHIIISSIKIKALVNKILYKYQDIDGNNIVKKQKPIIINKLLITINNNK